MSAPVYFRIRGASLGLNTSPLARTGIFTARLTSRIQSQLAVPAYIWFRVRPWTATAAAPASSIARANSTQLMEPLSQPSRNFTVTGQPAPRTTSLQHPDRLVRVPHQARAVPGVGHLGHGAAHVDVDEVRPGHLVGDGGRLLHAHQVAAEDLGGGGVLPLPQLEQGNGLFILKAQGLGTDHFGTGQPCPLLPADGAERQVCHPAMGASASGTSILIPPISTMGTSWK